MKVCIIPARADSKQLPGKNSRIFMGLPLLAHSIRQAIRSEAFDHIAFSSDSDEYLGMARTAGAGIIIKRPDELASDAASMLDVIRHATCVTEEHAGTRANVITLLQVTSPLREPRHVRECMALLDSRPDASNVISVMRAKASPYFTLCETGPDGFLQLSKQRPGGAVRRQDLPEVWQINGSIYVWRREALFSNMPLVQARTIHYEMDMLNSFDVDSIEDFRIAEFVGYDLLRLHEQS